MASICIEVSLLSGRTAKITREAQCSIEEFKQEALDSLEMCAGVLLTTSGEMLCQGTLEEAGLKDGDAVLLQQRQVDILDSLELDVHLSHRRGASIQAPERFAILDLVARGAYGCVSSARDEITGDTVAIKKMQAFESKMRSFESIHYTRQELKELRLLRHFHHENIIDVRYIYFPGSKTTFHDLYSVSELMETDLHLGLSQAALHIGEIGEGFPPRDAYPYVGNEWYRAPEALCHRKNVQHQLKLIVQGLGPWKEESSLSWIKQPEIREFVESLSPAVDRKAFCESLGFRSPSAMELLDARREYLGAHGSCQGMPCGSVARSSVAIVRRDIGN
eukprot:s259_g16.t1